MTEPRRFPFGGVPVYNPQSLSKSEALAQFHARQAAYDNLIEILREERPSHVLIIGTRGMGKTTLLQRVRYGVEDDPELHQRFIVLAFPEEQYNVTRLHHFYLNALDALADAVERLKDHALLSRVEAFTKETTKLAPEDIESKVPDFLENTGTRLKRSFLLLVDNADRLFETIAGKQQWKLRELLSYHQELTFFGATTQASQGIYDNKRAFFEFFKVVNLAPLRYSEVRDLLVSLSESVDESESEKGTTKRRVAEWLDSDPARLRTLVQLTGGNPRTTVLLFHLVLDGLSGGAREYLEQLLDQVTPNYKGRVDELPLQAQQVLDAVALRWDPVTAIEIAKEIGLDTNKVSTQLTRLVRQGLLEKADLGDSKKALYQVAERFFNIWYLMRASRRVRAKLRWFVEFLRVFFDSTELERMAIERIEHSRSTWRGHPEEVETAFAYVVASGAGRARYEDHLRQTCAETEDMWRPYLPLLDRVDFKNASGSSKPTEATPRLGGSKPLPTEEEARRAVESAPNDAEQWRTLGRVLMKGKEAPEEAEAAFRRAIDLAPGSASAWSSLGGLLARTRERRAEAEAAFRTAIELDPHLARAWNLLGDLLNMEPERGTEAEAAYRKAIDLEPKEALFWADLGRCLTMMTDRKSEAEAVCRRAIELSPESISAWAGLANLLILMPDRKAEAEAAYRRLLELAPTSAPAWVLLGILTALNPDRAVEAEAAFRRALELSPTSEAAWFGLGSFLAHGTGREPEAETAFRKGIEVSPASPSAWIGLANLLAQSSGRETEAEQAYRNAISLDPNTAHSWAWLGNLLAEKPERRAEAEAAFRKAIELDPKAAHWWNNLGTLFSKTPERRAEAEAAFRRAIELDPSSARSWGHHLAELLAEVPERATEAEEAYRKAIELDPNAAHWWRHLGDFLSKTPERTAEAEGAYRRAIDLEPKTAHLWGILAGLLEETPERSPEAEAAYHRAIALEPKIAHWWGHLGDFLSEMPGRLGEAEGAYRKALELEPEDAGMWHRLGVFLACETRNPEDAEVAFQNALRFGQDRAEVHRNFGVLLYTELGKLEDGIQNFRRAYELNPTDSITAAIFASARPSDDAPRVPGNATDGPEFWNGLLELCQKYAPFGKILLRICDLVHERNPHNRYASLYRAVAHAQLDDFPRAIVALEDALTGDPIELVAMGRTALETFLAAGVRNGRERDCIELIDRKEWRDAWRPIYEALRAVEAGSADYLIRVAVEIREPAQLIFNRITKPRTNASRRNRPRPPS